MYPMKDRVLLRTNFGSLAWTGAIPAACITSDNSFFPSMRDKKIASDSRIIYGSIDSSSGLAYVVRREESGSESSSFESKFQLRMFIWKHRVYSLNEAMGEPDVLVTCTHPEYDRTQNGEDMQFTSLACLIPASSQSKTAGLGLYWCSSNGVLCYYDMILGPDRGRTARSLDYKTLTRIPLEHNELVTFVSARFGRETGGIRSLGESVFIGTSSSRVWICTRCTRPLELKVRLLDLTKHIEDDDEPGKYWLGGLVSKFFTPSKDATLRHQLERQDPIVSIHCMALDDASVKRPYKGRKVTHPSTISSSDSVIDHLFFIIHRSGQISTCTITYNLHEKVYKDQCLHSMSLKRLMKRVLSELQSKDTDIVRKTIHQIHVLNAKLDDTGCCMVICVKAVFADADESPVDQGTIGRLYMLYCPIHRQDFSVTLGSFAWLTRYTSDTVLSQTNPLQCAGMMVQSGVEKELVDVSVYSVIQSQNKNMNQEGKPVTISGVHFGRFPDEEKKQIQVQIRDIDLPSEIAPSVISGAVGMDAATDGFVAISSTGCITCTRLNFPLISLGSPRKSDSISKETVQVLRSHLLSEYMIYKRRLEHHHRSLINLLSESIETDRTSLSISNLPPSIMNADSAELTLSVIVASKSLMDDGFGIYNRNGSKPIVPNFNPTIVLEVLDEKCDAHCSFIDFLIAGQLYKKVDTTGRIQLRNHGELLHGARGLILTWHDILEGALTVEVPDLNADIVDEEQRKINQILLGCEETLSNFHSTLNRMQLLLYDDGSSKASPLLFQYVFILIGRFARHLLTYRQQSSDHKYDVMCSPGFFGWEHLHPWTSEDEYMSLLEGQLTLVETISKDDKEVFLTHDIESLIETFSCHLLDGFRDRHYMSRDECRYDAAKRLCVSLVLKYCPNYMIENEVNLAFYLSLRHCYFDGIIEGCLDHDQPNIELSDLYDLSNYLRSVTVISVNEETDDDVYHALATAKDYRTGLSFPQYLFKWFSDRGLFGTVLELGKCCPVILTQYMIDDSRLSHLLWIQYVRNQDISSASQTLTQQGLTGRFQHQEDVPDSDVFKNPQLLLSLSKLCNATQ